MMPRRRGLAWLLGGLALLLVVLSVRRIARPTEAVGPEPAPERAARTIAEETSGGERAASVVPEAARAAEARATGFRFRTIDPEGRALARVEVSWQPEDEGRSVLGASDADGHLSTGGIRGGSGWVRASRADRETVTIPWDPARAPVVTTLVLGDGGSLRGRVLLTTGEDAGPGVRVAAFEARLGAIDLRTAPGEHDLPGGRIVVTDREGRFSFRGLRSGGAYDLLAAGNGFATPARVARVPADGREVDVVVHALFGVVARFVDAETGGAAALPKPLLPGSANTLTLAIPGARMVDAGQTLALAGIDGSVFDDFPTIRACLVTLPPDAAVGARVELACDLPGYVPSRAELELQPVVAALPEQRIVLVRDAVTTARIEVEVRGLPDGWHGPTSRRRPAFRVTLNSDAGAQLHLRFDRIPVEPTRVAHVPVGTYRVGANAGVALTGCTWRPGAPFEVRAGEEVPARLVVDASGWGGIAADLQQVDGSPYAGPAVLELRKPKRNSVEHEVHRVDFGSAPYEVFGLAPGTYEVLVQAPHVLEPRGATVSVERGDWSGVAFRVDASR